MQGAHACIIVHKFWYRNNKSNNNVEKAKVEYFKVNDSIELWWMAELDAQTGNKESRKKQWNSGDTIVLVLVIPSASDTDSESSNDTAWDS